MSEKESKTESVVLNLPKNLVEYVRACMKNPEQYLEQTIIEGVQADLDNQEIIVESICEKYGLP